MRAARGRSSPRRGFSSRRRSAAAIGLGFAEVEPREPPLPDPDQVGAGLQRTGRRRSTRRPSSSPRAVRPAGAHRCAISPFRAPEDLEQARPPPSPQRQLHSGHVVGNLLALDDALEVLRALARAAFSVESRDDPAARAVLERERIAASRLERAPPRAESSHRPRCNRSKYSSMSASGMLITLPYISAGASGVRSRCPGSSTSSRTPSVPTQQGMRDHGLRSLAVVALDLARHQQVEGLIGAADLDVRAQRDRVVGLRERIQQLVNRDRLVRGVALREVVALEQSRHRVARAEANPSPRATGGPSTRC